MDPPKTQTAQQPAATATAEPGASVARPEWYNAKFLVVSAARYALQRKGHHGKAAEMPSGQRAFSSAEWSDQIDTSWARGPAAREGKRLAYEGIFLIHAVNYYRPSTTWTCLITTTPNTNSWYNCYKRNTTRIKGKSTWQSEKRRQCNHCGSTTTSKASSTALIQTLLQDEKKKK